MAPVLNNWAGVANPGDSAGTSFGTFPTDDPHTVKVWSQDTEREIVEKTLYNKFIPSNIVMEFDELTKSAGDVVKFSLEYLISGVGKSEGETLEKKGLTSEYSQDELRINELRQAYEWFGGIFDQRTVHNRRSSARGQLSDWWADTLDEGTMLQVCSYTADLMPDGATTKVLAHTALNTVTEPTAPTLLNAYAADGEFNAAMPASLDVIREMIYYAKTVKRRTAGDAPNMRPVRIDGGEYWVVLADPLSVKNIRASTEWRENYLNAMSGGMISDNPIFTGAIGVVDGAIIYESNRVPPACNWSTLSGATAGDGTTVLANSGTLALLGQGALALAYGREGGRAERYEWKEDSWDYGKHNGISAGLIYGMKKVQFGGVSSEPTAPDRDVVDYGVITAAVKNDEAVS